MANILQESFSPYVKRQINIRQQKLGALTRDNNTLVFTTSNAPFIKLTSSINVTANKCREIGLPDSFSGNNLAEKFVLFGGTVEEDHSGSPILKSGVASNYNDFNNSSYGFLTTSDYGLIPMPGITSIDVKSLNRGSLRECTINITCHSKQQFLIIETLFLRLKYSFLLEWGHSVYFKNDGTLSTENFSNSSLFLGGGDGDVSDQNYILKTLETSRNQSNGNYDAFLGYVKNFNWTLRPDGGYDITVSGITFGDVIESLKMNVLRYDDADVEEQNEEEANLEGPPIEKDKNRTTLNQIFYALKKLSEESDGLLTEESFVIIDEVTCSKLKELIPSLPDVNLAKYAGSKFINNGDAPITQSQPQPQPPPKTPSPTQVQEEGFFSSVGNFVSEAVEAVGEFVSEAVEVVKDLLEEDPSTDPNSNIGGLREYVRVEFSFDDENTGEEQSYLKLGALLRLIEMYMLYYDSSRGSDVPIINIQCDYGLTDKSNGTYCFRLPETFSTDPRICLVPISNEYLDGIKNNQGTWNWIVNPDPGTSLTTFNNALGNGFNSMDSPYIGNIMHIHVNLNFVSRVLNENIDEDGNISLLNFMNNILSEIQQSLGGINKFSVIFNEDTNSFNIIDDTYIPGLRESLSKSKVEEPARFNVNILKENFGSFVESVSIKSEITKNIANMITVGAQANGNAVGENATAFSEWNVGLIDRIIKEKQDRTSSTTTTEGEESSKKTPEEVFAENAKKIYNYLLTYIQLKVDEEDVENYKSNSKSYFNYITGQLSQKSSDGSPAKIPAIGFIPLSLDITMMGLSGMKIYQKYSINEDLLPPNYVNKIEFLTKGISHKVDNKGWVTSIDGLSIPKNIDAKTSQTRTKTFNSSALPSNSTGPSSNSLSQPNTSNSAAVQSQGNCSTLLASSPKFAGEPLPKFKAAKGNNPVGWTLFYGPLGNSPGVITSRFTGINPRQDIKRAAPHRGIDIDITGTATKYPLYAVWDGTITNVRAQGGNGSTGGGFYIVIQIDTNSLKNDAPYLYNSLISELGRDKNDKRFRVKDGAKLYAVFMHLEKANSGLLPCLSPDLTVGSSFKRGQLLGIADNSGGSTGAHLHFQLHTVPKTDNWNSWLFGENEQKNLSQIDPTNWIYIKGRNT